MAFRYNFLTRPPSALPLILVLVGLAGCQGVTKEDWTAFCNNNNWAEHGYFDATNGFPIQMLNVYKDRCGDNLSPTEAKVYQRGFLKGIKEFCTYENGYALGRENEGNPGTCPPELEKPFNAGFKTGLGEYWGEDDAKRKLEKMQRDREAMEAEKRRREQSGR